MEVLSSPLASLDRSDYESRFRSLGRCFRFPCSPFSSRRVCPAKKKRALIVSFLFLRAFFHHLFCFAAHSGRCGGIGRGRADRYGDRFVR